MANIKIQGNTKFFGNTIFSTSGGGEGGEGGGGGGGFVSPLDTTIYDSQGNILFTVNGNVPENWKNNAGIEGYVDIGSSVTSIGSYAFYYNALTSVTIPNSVTSIGSYAFNFNLLTSVTIPNSVTSIGNYVFGNNQLTSVTIPNSVTSIGNYAFRSNQLASVTIPNSVTTIGNYAFGNNTTLAEVNCNVALSVFVGSNAFQGTASPLTIHARVSDASWTAGTGLSFQGNNDVTVIKDLEGGGFVSPLDTTIYNPNGTLYDTEGNPLNGNIPENWKTSAGIAGYVDVGSSVTSIGSYAFGYNQLTSVTIPDSVTSIGNYAFSENRLASVTIGNSVTSIGSLAFSGNQLASVTIPNSVTSIGGHAFYINQLTSVTIGNSVTTIGSYAFYSNQLASVTIPNSVTTIGSYAFSNNTTLAEVNCNVALSVFVGSGAFHNTASPLTIHARATDGTWTAGTGLSFQGNNNVTVIKDL